MSGRHKRRKRPRITERGCLTCEHCLRIGEGDHVCDESYGPRAKLVLEECVPGEDFFWCGGKKWEER